MRSSTIAVLERHAWPGNVRELRDVIERATVIAEGDVIPVDDLSERLRAAAGAPAGGAPAPASRGRRRRDRRAPIDVRARGCSHRPSMRDAWRIGMWMDVRMVTSQAPPPPDSEALPAAQAAAWVRSVLDEGARGRATILEIAEALQGGAASHRTTVDEAIALVRRGLAGGRLHAYAQKHVGGGKGPESAEPPSAEPPREDTKTFVAVQLLSDEPEPKPVPFKRYRITLPDETVREGQLDQFGRALITGIDPGTCKVSFPDFDGPDWKAA